MRKILIFPCVAYMGNVVISKSVTAEQLERTVLPRINNTIPDVWQPRSFVS